MGILLTTDFPFEFRGYEEFSKNGKTFYVAHFEHYTTGRAYSFFLNNPEVVVNLTRGWTYYLHFAINGKYTNLIDCSIEKE